MESPFSLKVKSTEQTLNQFYYYQINYNNSCVCLNYNFTIIKSILLFLCLLKGGNTLLSPHWLSPQRQQLIALSFLTIFLKASTICSLLLFRSSQAKIFFFFPSLGFTLYFPCPYRKDPWAKANAKAIKFFVALSIYKTIFLFSLGLEIHYLFNKEYRLSFHPNE